MEGAIESLAPSVPLPMVKRSLYPLALMVRSLFTAYRVTRPVPLSLSTSRGTAKFSLNLPLRTLSAPLKMVLTRSVYLKGLSAPSVGDWLFSLPTRCCLRSRTVAVTTPAKLVCPSICPTMLFTFPAVSLGRVAACTGVPLMLSTTIRVVGLLMANAGSPNNEYCSLLVVLSCPSVII